MAVEPYDWRLAYALLEERDGYFTQLQHRIQVLHETTGEKVVITSHSMGVLVVHYFLTWVTEQHSGGQTNWVDEHVQAYINLAGTHLGVPKAVTALLSGEMSDTVMVFNPLANAVEHYFGRALRADLWQTWGSLWSMFPKGGNRLWGSAVDLENCGTTGTGTGGESSKFNVSSKSPPSKNRDNSSDDDTKNDNADDADDMDSDKKKSEQEQEQEQRKLNRWNDPFCAATVLDEVWENDDMDDNDDDDDDEIDFDHDDPFDRFFGSVAGFSPFLAIADPSTLEAIANYDDLLWLQSNSSSTSSATATSDDHSNSSSVNNNDNDTGTRKNVADIKACQALLGNDSVDNGGGGFKVKTPIVDHHEDGSKATTDDDNETNEATTTTSGDNYCPAPWSRLPDFVLEDRDLSVTAVMKYLQTRGLKQGLRNAELFSLYNEKQEQDDGVHVLDHDDKKKEKKKQQKDKKKTKKDKQDERQKAWHDATQTPLPNAPNLKIYCLYGINKPTERAYYYKLHPLLVDDSTDNDPDGDPWFILDTDINIPEQNVHYGIKYSNGDGSVPLLSLGYVCVDAWTRPNGARRGPNLNPGQAAVYTREYPHLPESTLEDPFRSGPKSGDHVDFLGNVDMTTDLLRIVTDFEASTTVNQNQIHSNIVEISQQVHDKYFDPKKKPSWHGQKPKQPQTMRMKKGSGGGGGGANPRMTTNSKDETDRRKRRQRRRRRYHKGNNYNNDRQSNSKKNLLRRISSFFFSGSRQRNQNNPL